MSDTIQTKQCSKCKQTFPATTEYFHKHPETKDGLRSLCKQCQNQKIKQYYQKHKAERVQYRHEYYAKHKVEWQEWRKRHAKTIKGRLRRAWHHIIDRCNNPKHKKYNRYGGRGIKVRFTSFEQFYDHVVNELKVDPRGLTIDRIDNDGHYEKGNIRFVTVAENSRNRRRKNKENRNGKRNT